MVLIDAIIRSTALEKTITALKAAGVKGMTFAEVKGLGEELDLYRSYSFHTRLQLLVPEDDENRIVDLILAQTSTGTQGDGLIMVHPISRAIKIRTKRSCSATN